MNRREAISSVAFLLGGTIIGSQAFILSGCSSSIKDVQDLFSKENIQLMDEVAETIIPKTSTPGAKDAKVGEFMAIMVKDCYSEPDQKTFIDGLQKIEDISKKNYSKNFVDCSPEQRKTILEGLDKEQKEYQQTKKEEDPQHFFRMIKELVLFGYFTSEEGGNHNLTYVEVPGRFDGCIPYKKGDPVYLNP
ncbi:twin-arginine translocation pathway signal [Pseudopedobacter saltans DSM 12145]|uniref:Twin-arginine translocation pathway signal n=1 Tax=Pseudopedobacter saltans (strain ATCC 51119 / DSM 12145 / JCM 21818 / CCUG 39354 / LMG 10337 / NBRC 100064 / NCIMB 13643) TaxID=762903 RepID=F0S744_PSESL|nr:gluconate 2-dehydrogenase subunit 3 family protein [Pseudopedobacter saltans]ADY54317.1 twin-arginine translocation pathway signal [Pseudopedobacter saltans DSM 12145]